MRHDLPVTNLLGVDIADVIALANDPAKMEAAYVRVFASTEGRAVLLDLMRSSNMLSIRPANMTHAELAHMSGHANFVIELLDKAGIQQAEQAAGLLLATMPQTEPSTPETDDERPEFDYPTGGPEPDAGDASDPEPVF